MWQRRPVYLIFLSKNRKKKEGLRSQYPLPEHASNEPTAFQ
jgi:hypothetical protein